jgi:MFS family permease
MTVLATGSLLPLQSAHWAVMLLSAALFGLSMFSAPSSISSFIKHVLPKPAWGSAMATFTMMFAAAQTVGPWAIGWLADRTGSLSGGLAVSGGVLALGALLAVFQRDPRVDAAASRAA